MSKKKPDLGSSILATPCYIPSAGLVAATLDGQVVKVNGFEVEPQIEWQGQAQGPVFHGLAVWEDTVITVSVQGLVKLFDSSDGKTLKIIKTHGQTFSGLARTSSGLVFGNHLSEVKCLQCRDSLPRMGWTTTTPALSAPVFATPFPLLDDHSGAEWLACLSTDGVLSFVSATDGTIGPSHKVGENTFSSSPVVWRNFLIIGSRDDVLECYKFQK